MASNEQSLQGSARHPASSDDQAQPASPTINQSRVRSETVDDRRSTRLDIPSASAIVVRDFEHAITDDDGDDNHVYSPVSPRTRRDTTARTGEPRHVSPPTSVKAFASSRRRNTTYSETGSDTREYLTRIVSATDGRSKAPTIQNAPGSIRTQDIIHRDFGGPPPEGDLSSNEGENYIAAEEHIAKDKTQSYIDFDYLERFMYDERESHIKNGLRLDATPRIFPDMRPQSVGARSTVAGESHHPAARDSASSEFDEKKTPPVFQGKTSRTDNSRFTFSSSAWESTLHASELVDLVPPGESIRKLFQQCMDEDEVWWLNCNNATKEESQGLGKAFGIHPLTIEDIVTHDPHEKVELFNAYYFASFQSFHPVEEDDGIEYKGFNIYLLIFPKGILSFSFVPNTHASFVRRRMMALKESVSVSSDWICYAIIDHIVDEFGPVIRQMEAEVDSIDDDVFIMRDDDSSTILKRIAQARKNCMALFRLLSGKADVLGGFTKRCNENYPIAPRMDIGLYLSDIQDHVVTMSTNITHFETILSRSYSNYLATVSVGRHSQGHMTNRVLSKITILAAIFVPLQLVSQIFGMNVQVPWLTDNNTSVAPFLGILGCMLFFAFFVPTLARFLRFL